MSIRVRRSHMPRSSTSRPRATDRGPWRFSRPDDLLSPCRSWAATLGLACDCSPIPPGALVPSPPCLSGRSPTATRKCRPDPGTTRGTARPFGRARSAASHRSQRLAPPTGTGLVPRHVREQHGLPVPTQAGLAGGGSLPRVPRPVERGRLLRSRSSSESWPGLRPTVPRAPPFGGLRLHDDLLCRPRLQSLLHTSRVSKPNLGLGDIRLDSGCPDVA